MLSLFSPESAYCNSSCSLSTSNWNTELGRWGWWNWKWESDADSTTSQYKIAYSDSDCRSMHVHKVAKTSKTRHAVFYASKTHDLINARKFAFWYCILMQRVTTSTRKSCKVKTEIICFRLCSISINRVNTLCKWMYCKYKPENQYFVSNMDRPIDQLSKYHHLRAVL